MVKHQKVRGLRDLEKKLFEIEKHTTRKSLARRVLKRAAQPVADKMNALAPDDPNSPGGLHESHSVSTKLNKRQRKSARRGGKSDVEVYAGTSDPAAIQQEFGNVNHGPQSYARPAWEATRLPALESIKEDLANEIVKVADRQKKRKAKG